MCLILFALDVDPEYRVVLAANRDEFYRRETAALHAWEDLGIIGGRDLQAGGTWLALSAEGTRMSAVTNVRDGIAEPQPGLRSRGQLPVDFLDGGNSAEYAAAALTATAAQYAPVNLLVDDGAQMWWATNHNGPRAARIEPGVHGLSNAALDDPWPKVVLGVAELRAHMESGDTNPESLLTMLHNTRTAAPESLPDTGVTPEQEEALSAMFLVGPEYGTRASTVVRIRHGGGGDITERRWNVDGVVSTERISF